MADLPPLTALRAFEAVARLDSVTRAAQELHVTHGAVSRQLRQLEECLGRPLFTRQGRGLKLTDMGHQLREGTSPALDQLRLTWRTLTRETPQAPLVLACPGSFMARWMIPRLERLSQELPGVALHLSAREDTGEAALREADALLLLTQPPWPAAYHVHMLAPERIGPVLSPRYQGAKRLIKQPEPALAGEALLHTLSRPQAWPAWARAMKLPTGALRYGQGFPHLYHLLEAAVAGLGVAIAPMPLVADELASGRLVAPWGFRRTRAAWLLAAPARVRDARVEALAAWLKQELTSH